MSLLTGKEFAEKYVGRKIAWMGQNSCLSGGIISGYSYTDNTIFIYEPPIGGILISHYKTLCLLRPNITKFYSGAISSHCRANGFLIDNEAIASTSTTKLNDNRFPHTCICKAPAYIGAYKIECSNSVCRNYKQQ